MYVYVFFALEQLLRGYTSDLFIFYCFSIQIRYNHPSAGGVGHRPLDCFQNSRTETINHIVFISLERVW